MKDKILIIEEKMFPSALGHKATQVSHHKPVVQAIAKLGENVFDFEYAVPKPIQDHDNSSVSEAAYAQAFNEEAERLFELIEQYQVIILMGSRLVKHFTTKPIAKCQNKPIKVGDKIFIPTYSSFYLHNNKRTCFNTFTIAFRHFNGDVLQKPLCDYEIVKSIERLQEVVEMRHISKIFSFDFETNSLDWHDKTKKATLISITFSPGFSFIIPFEHHEFSWGGYFQQMIDTLKPMFADPNVTKVAHNLKFDFHWLEFYGIPLAPRIVDTMQMSHILCEYRKHGLKQLCKDYFPFWAGYDDGVDFLGPLNQLAKYAGMDTNITLMLFYIFENELLEQGNEAQYVYLRNLTMPALIALQEMESRGAKLDRDLINESIVKAEELLEKKRRELDAYPTTKKYVIDINKEKCDKKIEEYQTKLEARKLKAKNPDTDRYIIKYKEEIQKLRLNQVCLYEEVNYNSPKQLAGLIYDGFKMKVPKVMGEYKRTTSRNELKEFKHPFMNTLFAYRTISKMLSTYYIGLLKKMDVNDCVHGSFLLHGTVTGRLASRGPNLQNIPSRLAFEDDDAEWCLKQVKKFFIPTNDEYVVIQADYSQAELRTIANFANEDGMKAVYASGRDIHTATGAAIAGMTYEEFEQLKIDDPTAHKDFRRGGKGANFSLIYGASPNAYIDFVYQLTGVKYTAKQESTSRKAFYKAYPKLLRYHKTMERMAKKNNYVETLFGRRRRFININNTTNYQLISKDIRDAINSPIQGTSGEFTIFCITLLYHRLPPGAFQWCTVHDSIFFYIRKDCLHLLEIVNDTCEDPPLEEYFGITDEDFEIKMKMDYEISNKSWGHMVEIGDFNAVREYIAQNKVKELNH